MRESLDRPLRIVMKGSHGSYTKRYVTEHMEDKSHAGHCGTNGLLCLRLLCVLRLLERRRALAIGGQGVRKAAKGGLLMFLAIGPLDAQLRLYFNLVAD